jgi:hypothetical protein
MVLHAGRPCRVAEVVSRSEGKEYTGRVCLRDTGRPGEVVVEPWEGHS